MALSKEQTKELSKADMLKPEAIPTIEQRLDKVRQTVEKHFPNLWPITESCLSVCASNLPADTDDPVALILVGPSSDAKTTVLDFFDGAEGVTYKSDKFTPKAFVSHASNVKRDKLDEVDLLPRIKHKVLITPELAPIFRGRDEELVDIFSILTRVLDGHGLTTDSGVHGQRGHTGDYLFAWLGATTPLPTKVWKVMAALGSRLFFLNTPDMEISDAELEGAITAKVSYRDAVVEINKAVAGFVVELYDHYGGPRGVELDRTKTPKAVAQWIAKLGRLVAKQRGVVSVWQDQGEALCYSPPNIEKPFRIVQILLNIARGHALISGRTQLTLEDIPVVAAVALSSGPQERTKIIKALRGKPALSTQDTADCLDVSLPTARKVMKQLELLGVCRLEEMPTTAGGEERWEISFSDAFTWLAGHDFKAISERNTHRDKNFSVSNTQGGKKLSVSESADKTTEKNLQVCVSDDKTDFAELGLEAVDDGVPF